jgi:hypothetical protein
MGCDHAHRNWLRFSTLWHFVALCGNPCKSFVFMALITYKQEVAGSSPALPTIFFNHLPTLLIRSERSTELLA